jgi:hypothetical protein
LQRNQGPRRKIYGIYRNIELFFNKKSRWTGCISPVDRQPVVHDGLQVAAAKGLTGARPHDRFRAQKLARAASNQSGGGGGPHRGLLQPARWRVETSNKVEETTALELSVG